MNQLMPLRRLAILCTALSLATVANAGDMERATDVTSSDRLRVGLVLGGGGARGAAHIGVLRELERMHIPIDAIAGTSMGAIVGGLYASGMSVDELEKLVAEMDWADAMSDEPERSDLRFRRKQDAKNFPVDLDIGLEHGRFKLPLGMVQGQKLDLILRNLTLPVSQVSDFDDLPIPFRAIASDIETGEMYVMHSGDLALAIRASMSVPGVLAPVSIDGHLLVDGGLVGNLPVDIVRDMGVDVVIAVDVEFPLYTLDELRSAITVSEQMLTILIRKETLRQIEKLGEGDVLITPKLGTFGSANFGAIVEAIEPGAKAAREAAPRLASLATDEAGFAAWQREREQREPTAERLAFVRVEHDSRLSARVFESRLGVAAGDPIDATELSAEAAQLHALDVFEKVSYRLVEEDGKTGVVFDARAKSWGPSFLNFGFTLEDDFEGATNFDLRARLTRPAVNRYGGEWRADLRLGTEPRLLTEFYQPLRWDSRLFVAPYIDFDQSNFNAFTDQDIVARLRVTELTGGFDIGAEIGNSGEFRLGAFRGGGEARVTIGDPVVPDPDFETGGLRALLRFDSLDKPWFPTSGVRADLEWTQSLRELGGDDRYDIIDMSVEAVRSRGKSTVGFGLDFQTTLSFDGAVQDLFRLGGFHRLSGYERGAISGPHAAVAKLLYYRRIGDSPGGLFDAPVYVGASLEAGNVWESRSDMSIDSTLLHGSLFVGIDSYVGPMFFAAGIGQGGLTNFYLVIGAPPPLR
ncbi:MAG: patatin-like phospholipase family protein [Gammaproteobacteria bacterium]|jgi:NTE family protein|nr:patatin-like phospholipase family protein [Gammaproteobacteria bacterium]MDH3863809.1 patatin-like phospholipase family protein [Gammaproteobacteria bacterium]MDH3953188.1 patatin-like phospholipase family protein [Gammaproteobacteria bacterium]NCF59126.1 BamA/TamA family outer membrane protein [Gammaproteobacteria bacterium]